jgi:hypothetical protein
MEDFSKYERLRAGGITAIAMWRQAQDDGLDFGSRIRMIRKVFGLTLMQAKEVSVKAESGRTLTEHQETLARGIEDVLESNDVLESEE